MLDEIKDFLLVPNISSENIFAMYVLDDSMDPNISKGDIVIIDPQKEFRSDLVVISQKQGYKIGNVKLMGKNRYFIVPTNIAYNPEEIKVDEDTLFYVPIKVISIFILIENFVDYYNFKHYHEALGM